MAAAATGCETNGWPRDERDEINERGVEMKEQINANQMTGKLCTSGDWPFATLTCFCSFQYAATSIHLERAWIWEGDGNPAFLAWHKFNFDLHTAERVVQVGKRLGMSKKVRNIANNSNNPVERLQLFPYLAWKITGVFEAGKPSTTNWFFWFSHLFACQRKKHTSSTNWVVAWDAWARTGLLGWVPVKASSESLWNRCWKLPPGKLATWQRHRLGPRLDLELELRHLERSFP